MKTCFKCGKEKCIDNFYKHPRMKDGHLNKCKACTRKDVRKHRAENLDAHRDRERSRKRPYSQYEEYQRLWKSSNPEKAAAHRMVRSAVKSGFLCRPDVCQECGDGGVIHGHHEDYSKPLDVDWLCVPCHHKRHPRKVVPSD